MTATRGIELAAASGTAAPAANDWPAVGEVSDTVGGVLPVVPTVNVTAGVTAVSAGLPLSTAVAVTVWLPLATARLAWIVQSRGERLSIWADSASSPPMISRALPTTMTKPEWSRKQRISPGGD